MIAKLQRLFLCPKFNFITSNNKANGLKQTIGFVVERGQAKQKYW
jgi:hypothetical protein